MSLPMVIAGHAAARSVDVSTTGIRFESSVTFPPGTRLVFLLRMGDAGFADLALHCEGRVVRVEGSSGKTCIAATIDRIQFQERSH